MAVGDRYHATELLDAAISRLTSDAMPTSFHRLTNFIADTARAMGAIVDRRKALSWFRVDDLLIGDAVRGWSRAAGMHRAGHVYAVDSEDSTRMNGPAQLAKMWS